MNHNLLERKVAAIICSEIFAEPMFQDVRNYDDKGILLIQYQGHTLKVSVSDLGETPQ